MVLHPFLKLFNHKLVKQNEKSANTDFNSLPESGVIEFIKNGKVAVNHPEFKVGLFIFNKDDYVLL